MENSQSHHTGIEIIDALDDLAEAAKLSIAPYWN